MLLSLKIEHGNTIYVFKKNKSTMSGAYFSEACVKIDQTEIVF